VIAARLAAAVLTMAALAGAEPAWAGRQYQTLPAAAGATVAASSPARLARWQGDRAAAFSFIFDDGLADHTAIVLPLLEAHRLRGTFALVTGRIPATAAESAAQADKARQAEKDPAKAAAIRPRPSWEDWRAAAGRGHELANHSVSHPGLAKMTPEQVAAEIDGGAAGLLAAAGVRALTFVGPGNQYGPGGLELVRATHLCWRIGGGLGYGRPQAGEDPPATAARWTARLEALAAKGGWQLSMVHAIIDGYDPTGEEAFRLHVAQAAALGDRLWIAPAGEVARYDLAVRHARLAAEPAGERTLRLRLEAGLDDALLLVPLTVVVETGIAPAAASARRGGAELPCRIAGTRLLIDAPPAAEPMEVAWR
jgi:peptidoglycan/xylan/chitin deacetylase (PgdA/CDA1 family)